MDIFTKHEQRGGLKMADDFIPADLALRDSWLPRTRYPYRRDIREGLGSNVIMSPVNWVARNFTEAEPVVERLVEEQWEPVRDHRLTVKLESPNDFYDGDTLFKATVISYEIDGNAYWLKLRNVFGEPVEFWYLPHFLVEPRWPKDGSEFISHYDYRPEWGGASVEIPVRDIVHIRYGGLDPNNTRKGLSNLKTLLREVFTDEEASNFSASILRNMGVPGGIIAPKGDQIVSQPHLEELKQFIESGFTGDKRGGWFALGYPTEVSQFGFDPNQLMLTNLRDITEERVCAAIGIQPSVVGFGAGLQQTKVGATAKDNRRSAWLNCIIPNQRTIGRQLSRQLVPDFQSQTRRFRVRFDASGIPGFAEEETEKTRRLSVAVEAGIMQRAEAREELGLTIEDSDRVYHVPANTVVVPAGEIPTLAEEAPPPSRNGGPPMPEDETEETLNRARAMLASIKEE